MRSLPLWVLLFCCACRTDEVAPVRVAAAADLSRAFTELGAQFEHQSGLSLSLVFGSTGLLAKQLIEGAPFDVFAAANVAFVEDVVAAGVCDKTTVQRYAEGRIVVWSRSQELQALSDLSEPRFKRVAIANPAHAPYGRAAREALEQAELWSTLEPRLVYGENVLQTLQLAQTGNAEAAIVALSLVSDDREHPWLPIEPYRHRAIEQALVVCRGGAQRAAGQAFAHMLGSRAGRELMRRHGFLLPGEELAARP